MTTRIQDHFAGWSMDDVIKQVEKERQEEGRGKKKDERGNKQIRDDKKEQDNINDTQNNKSFQKTKNKGLGQDYGLIFINGSASTTMVASIDGTTAEIISDDGGFQDLYFDEHKGQERLLYTKSSTLYEIILHNTGGGNIVGQKLPLKMFHGCAHGITRLNDKIIVCIDRRDEGRIVTTSNDPPITSKSRDPRMVTILKGKIYHTEGTEGRKGLIESTTDSVIQQTGEWCHALTRIGDKIYFGGENRNVYSYDGTIVRKIHETSFPIWTMSAVEEKNDEVLYIGGNQKRGILKVPIKNPTREETILEERVYEVSSITIAPIEFIKKIIGGTVR